MSDDATRFPHPPDMTPLARQPGAPRLSLPLADREPLHPGRADLPPPPPLRADRQPPAYSTLRVDGASPWRAWIVASQTETIAHELELIYADVSRAISARGPACWASGRCCNFEKTGHRLYCTALEAAYAVTRLSVAPSRKQIALARVRGDCPFLADNLCGIHHLKPLGCRVYFCDRSAQDWQRDLSEAALTRIRNLHERHAIEYWYAEWRTLLDALAAVSSGRTDAESRPHAGQNSAS
ncbi:MAG: YkgJ family cysteine cluster protein [Planctomycetota bacterium]|nr:YkgJ family cysteine cluster protein [Planctomycetota bacterium]